MSETKEQLLQGVNLTHKALHGNFNAINQRGVATKT